MLAGGSAYVARRSKQKLDKLLELQKEGLEGDDDDTEKTMLEPVKRSVKDKLTDCCKKNKEFNEKYDEEEATPSKKGQKMSLFSL
jgi:hypothetical protein